MSTAQPHVVILGAGVIGLTVAHVLSNIPDAYRITIVARDMPEDLDSQAFASPWAGANWSPIRGFSERTARWEAKTFNKLWDMIPSGLAMAVPTRLYAPDETLLEKPWFVSLVRDFHSISSKDLPPNAKSGVAYTTVSVNPEVYLPWLKSELVSRNVQLVRRRIQSLMEVIDLAGPSGVVINASGLGARSLIGVEDQDVHPVRGQTIIVHAPAVRESIMWGVNKSDGTATYIIPRPSPPGTALLGGTLLPDVWDLSVNFDTARGILARCAAVIPSLADKKETQILRHNVGLRPARTGGARVEAEWVDLPVKSEWEAEKESSGKKALVIHAYGFGAAGYQNSWGAAEDIAALLKENYTTVLL